jgi:hypothetical protein
LNCVNINPNIDPISGLKASSWQWLLWEFTSTISHEWFFVVAGREG